MGVVFVRSAARQIQGEAARPILLVCHAARFEAGHLGLGFRRSELGSRLFRLGSRDRTRRILGGDLEEGDRRLKVLGPACQLLGRVRDLLGRGGVLLGHGIELLDRLVDLAGADILFAAGGADLGDEFGGAADTNAPRNEIRLRPR